MYKIRHHNKEYFVKANDAIDAVSHVMRYLSDERLSPMSYRKLKELGYDSESWKGKTQEWANAIIRKHENNTAKSSGARNTGHKNKVQRIASESNLDITNAQFKSEDDRNNFTYIINKIERYLKSDKERFERGGDTYNTKEELASRIRHSSKQLEDYKKLSRLAQQNDFEITVSPYSGSVYAIPKGEKVEWGYKPEGSYRVSNHWNWETKYGDYETSVINCPTNTGEDFGQAVAIFKNGKYYKV